MKPITLAVIVSAVRRLAFAVLLTPLLGTAAFAQSYSQGYVGAAVGRMFVNGWGYDFVGGYVFNRWIGVQLAYFNFPERDKDLFFPVGTIDTKAVGAGLVFSPLHTHKLDGRVYVGVAEVTSTFTSTSTVFTVNLSASGNVKRSTQPLAGISLDIGFDRNVALRLALDIARASDATGAQYEPFMQSAGLLIRF